MNDREGFARTAAGSSSSEMRVGVNVNDVLCNLPALALLVAFLAAVARGGARLPPSSPRAPQRSSGKRISNPAVSRDSRTPRTRCFLSLRCSGSRWMTAAVRSTAPVTHETACAEQRCTRLSEPLSPDQHTFELLQTNMFTSLFTRFRALPQYPRQAGLARTQPLTPMARLPRARREGFSRPTPERLNQRARQNILLDEMQAAIRRRRCMRPVDGGPFLRCGRPLEPCGVRRGEHLVQRPKTGEGGQNPGLDSFIPGFTPQSSHLTTPQMEFTQALLQQLNIERDKRAQELPLPVPPKPLPKQSRRTSSNHNSTHSPSRPTHNSEFSPDQSRITLGEVTNQSSTSRAHAGPSKLVRHKSATAKGNLSRSQSTTILNSPKPSLKSASSDGRERELPSPPKTDQRPPRPTQSHARTKSWFKLRSSVSQAASLSPSHSLPSSCSIDSLSPIAAPATAPKLPPLPKHKPSSKPSPSPLKRRPSIPEIALKVLVSFGRKEPTDIVSDAELDSWRKPKAVSPQYEFGVGLDDASELEVEVLDEDDDPEVLQITPCRGSAASTSSRSPTIADSPSPSTSSTSTPLSSTESLAAFSFPPSPSRPTGFLCHQPSFGPLPATSNSPLPSPPASPEKSSSLDSPTVSLHFSHSHASLRSVASPSGLTPPPRKRRPADALKHGEEGTKSAPARRLIDSQAWKQVSITASSAGARHAEWQRSQARAQQADLTPPATPPKEGRATFGRQQAGGRTTGRCGERPSTPEATYQGFGVMLGSSVPHK